MNEHIACTDIRNRLSKLNGRQNSNFPTSGSTIAEDKMWTNKIETRTSDGYC